MKPVRALRWLPGAPALVVLALFSTAAAGEAPRVAVAELESAPVTETTRVNGSVVARRHSSLSTTVSGRVESVAVIWTSRSPRPFSGARASPGLH